MINRQKIAHVFDPPHLIKGIRNNLLRQNLIWQKGGEKLVAQWSDIYIAYKINTSTEIRAMPILTEGHVNPNKIRKMKVSCATQTFSYNVALVMALMANGSKYFIVSIL